MTIRTCLAGLTLALWFSGAHASPSPLATLVRAYRDSPTQTRRSSITNYAASHPKEAPLVALALGIAAYEQRDFPSVIGLLQPVPAQVPAVADYAAYYLAAARVEMAQYDSVARDLAPTRNPAVPSPLLSRSWIVEARALKASDPQAAIRLLLDHYGELPEPEADITLADCYLAANQLPNAADYYQRVYYGYLSGDAAARAAAGIQTLKDRMGANYPAPPVALQLRHAGLLVESRDYLKSKAEYAAIPGDLARVGLGNADFQRGAIDVAWPYLRDLSLPAGEADAERVYHLTECARRRNEDGDLHAALNRLESAYRKSPWRLRALNSAANRYVLANRPDDYVPLFREIYRDFPASPGAPLAHWKVTFQAWMRNQPEAAALLREHLRDYGTHSSSAGAALYFLGRSFEQAGDLVSARACYQRLATVFENHYYAILARTRLREPAISGAATATGEIVQFLSGLKFTPAPLIPDQATAATTSRIGRSRLLRAAGLGDYADSELRFGARRDGQPALLAMEMAECADATHQSLRLMKLMNPDYLNMPITAAPRKFWELLFPLPYKVDLMRSAQDRGIDPYLLAGLIRQESEFNPAAVSHAKAYGLTQIRPATGRQYARRAGVSAFNTRLLSQPGPSLKIGSSILKSMLDAQGGSLEQTLAAYNAGPARVTDWLTWAPFREPAEFVESIPFTETRDYVQAVMRNAEMYRRLYR